MQRAIVKLSPWLAYVYGSCAYCTCPSLLLFPRANSLKDGQAKRYNQHNSLLPFLIICLSWKIRSFDSRVH